MKKKIGFTFFNGDATFFNIFDGAVGFFNPMQRSGSLMQMQRLVSSSVLFKFGFGINEKK